MKSSTMEIVGLVGIVGVLYLLTKNKAANAAMQTQQPAYRPPSPISIYPPAGTPITRANNPVNSTPFYLDLRNTNPPPVFDVPSFVGEAPYYLNRNTPAYPVAASDLPPAQQPAWFNPDNAIWKVTP